MAKQESRHAELVSASQTNDAPYELPEGWKWVRLKDVCDLLNGFAFKSSDYVKSSKVMNFRMSQIRPGGFTDLYHNTKYLPDSYAIDYKEFLLKDGDIVIAMTDMANDTKILGVPSIVYTDGYKLLLNQRVGKLYNISKSVYPKFLNYMMVSPYTFNYYKSLGKGGLQLNLSKTDILNAIIPLPSTLEEQQRIVNRIESMFAKLDEAKEKAQNVVDSFETRKAAILHQAFTGNLTAKWRKENGVSDDSWEERTIEEIYQINPKIKADDQLSASFIPMEKIEANSVNRFTYEVKPWGSIKKNHTQFADGDVCFAKISPCFENGKAFVARSLENGIGAGTTELIILRNSEIDVHYTYYLVTNSDFVHGGCTTYSGTVGQQRISMDFVRNYKIPVPTRAEQQEIVRILDTVLEKERTAKEAAQTVLDQIALLKKSVLARAFRGEL